jgi:S-formylglutathione hydrolase
MALETISEHRCFDGIQGTYTHASTSTSSAMRFAVYQPPAARNQKVPVLYYLSGLTCTEENFSTKAGAQRYAAEHGVMLVVPDTSPRGLGLPGETAAWDFGAGASFYVDATESPWRAHYRMYSYLTEELPALIAASFPADPSRKSIFGHSMGGHGALVIALRNPSAYRSVSAFAPIAAPMRCAWGEKAFGGYLGPDRAKWAEYDATELVSRSDWRRPILIDIGLADEFLEDQLLPDVFERACQAAGVPLELHRREGYGHSYWFVSSFVGAHIAHHARALDGR